jgi:acetylornithine deacetylase/succinyl-diaminopimelate desuccinylase-like protein
MTRANAVACAHTMLRSGEFLRQLDRRVAYQTESQNPEQRDALRAYLTDELQPSFASMDFSTRLIESPTGKGPYLLAEYRESASAPTVLIYGHGDVVDGMAGEWRDNLDPWRTTQVGNRVYGRGTAAASSASTSNSSSRPARKSARRICRKSADNCAMN